MEEDSLEFRSVGQFIFNLRLRNNLVIRFIFVKFDSAGWTSISGTFSIDNQQIRIVSGIDNLWIDHALMSNIRIDLTFEIGFACAIKLNYFFLIVLFFHLDYYLKIKVNHGEKTEFVCGDVLFLVHNLRYFCAIVFFSQKHFVFSTSIFIPFLQSNQFWSNIQTNLLGWILIKFWSKEKKKFPEWKKIIRNMQDFFSAILSALMHNNDGKEILRIKNWRKI